VLSGDDPPVYLNAIMRVLGGPAREEEPPASGLITA
jgi:hypothetical protein